MVRGHAKAEAKAKAAKNAPKEAKSSLAVKAEALRFVCPFCKVSGHYYKAMKDHYESKHPKETCPPEDSFVKVK